MSVTLQINQSMDIRLQCHPGTRYTYQASHRYYYTQGSSAAKDFLENVSDVRDPKILLLGCGDLRGCIYTLWKHFDPPSSLDVFHGAHFVLNDMCSATLARDVLHLYYIAMMPSWKEPEAVKQWVSNLWSVWYCHELLPPHDQSLRSILTTLVNSSTSLESWRSSEDNLLRNIVSFTNSSTLEALRVIWEMWLTKSFGSIDVVHTGRLGEFKEKLALSSPLGGMDAHVIPSITTFLGVLRTTDVSREELESLGADFSEYLQTGSSYAEDIFSLPHTTNRTVINPTVFEDEDGIYNVQYAAAPFRSFYHILEVSKCEVQKLGMSPTIAGQPLAVEDTSFQSHPLLSNCVQQFTVWVTSAAASLKMQISRAKPDITFVFDHSHAISCCEEMLGFSDEFVAQTGFQPMFHAIYTASLFDTLSVPVVINSCLPLLIPNGVIIAKSRIHTLLECTTGEYLDSQLGFSTELLPIMMGARCISLDGKYSDSNGNEPVPVSITTILGTMKEAQHHPSKELFWTKMTATSLKISSLTELPIVLDALHGAIHVATVSFLVKESGLVAKIGMCTESAVHTILLFASQLDSDIDIRNHQFWEPLSARIRGDTKIQPIIVHLQSQLLLHGLHLHLVFSKDDCPLCMNVPLMSVIGQFTGKVDPSPQGAPSKSSPFFVAIVHKESLPKWLPMHFLPELGRNIHVVDSVQGRDLPDKKVKMDFLFPKLFVRDGYKATIIRYDIGVHRPNLQGKDNMCLPSLLLESDLKSMECSHTYQFRQVSTAASPHKPTTSSSEQLGSLLSHYGDADHMETTVSLTYDTMAAMKTAPLKNKRFDETTIELSCGALKLQIKYPYPFDFSKITTKLNKKKGTLVLKASRMPYKFYNERPMFIANPDNKITFPPLPVSQTVYSTITGMQFTRKERALFDAYNSKSSDPLPPPINVKNWIIYFFKRSSKLFTIHSKPDPKTGEKSVWVLVVVHSRVFDTVRQTPALDLSYCIMNKDIFHTVFQHWKIVCIEPSMTPTEISGSEQDYAFLCNVLDYFTRRTHRSVKNPSHMLRKYHIDHYFTRCMVYPLYCDPERFLIEMEFAKKTFDIDRAREIPFPPWSSLNPNNSRSNAPADRPSYPFATVTSSSEPLEGQKECSYCRSRSNKMKKCTGCGKTWYCGKECQASHWKTHKTSCKPLQSPSSSQLEGEALTRCARCSQSTLPLKNCACHLVAYCSKECQRYDWSSHRSMCLAIRSSRKN